MIRQMILIGFLVASTLPAEELQIAVSAPESLGLLEVSLSTVDPKAGVIEKIDVRLADGLQEQVRLHVTTNDALFLAAPINQSVVKLNTPVQDLPSRYISISFTQHGAIILGRWPIVTWKSGADPLDALLNGETVGTTTETRSISPGTQHSVGWRNSEGKIVCTKDVKLEANVERTYTCDPGTGSVSG